jgi:hypothetical protein
MRCSHPKEGGPDGPPSSFVRCRCVLLPILSVRVESASRVCRGVTESCQHVTAGTGGCGWRGGRCGQPPGDVDNSSSRPQGQDRCLMKSVDVWVDEANRCVDWHRFVLNGRWISGYRRWRTKTPLGMIGEAVHRPSTAVRP